VLIDICFTHREAIEPEILLERDGSSDACEPSRRWDEHTEWKKRWRCFAHPPPMMTMRVISSVSGRSASQSAVEVALEDVMTTSDGPFSPEKNITSYA
jgi:hypothetical protein